MFFGSVKLAELQQHRTQVVVLHRQRPGVARALIGLQSLLVKRNGVCIGTLRAEQLDSHVQRGDMQRLVTSSRSLPIRSGSGSKAQARGILAIAQRHPGQPDICQRMPRGLAHSSAGVGRLRSTLGMRRCHP